MQTTISPEDRRERLARQIAFLVPQGRRVQSQSDYQAVLVRGKSVNHILHLILALVTAGFWVIIWLALVVFGGEKREIVSVDEFGNVIVSKV